MPDRSWRIRRPARQTVPVVALLQLPDLPTVSCQLAFARYVSEVVQGLDRVGVIGVRDFVLKSQL